jgi:denticleless
MRVLDHIFARQVAARPVAPLSKRILLKDFRSLPEAVAEFSSSSSSSVPPFNLSFSTRKLQGHLLAVADEDGCVSLLDTRTSPLSEGKTAWLAHANAIFDVEWNTMDNDNTMLTASGDQTIKLWDVATQAELCVFKGHKGSVKSLKFQPHNPHLFASGARDGHMLLWDTRSANPVHTLRNIHTRAVSPRHGAKRRRHTVVKDSQQSVTCASFTGDGQRLISAGAVDGCVKFWDMRRLVADDCESPVHTLHPNSGSTSARNYGISALAVNSTGTQLLVSSTNSQHHLFNCMAPSNVLGTFHGHVNSSFYVKSTFSPDDGYIASGSCDKNVYVWKINNPGPPALVLSGHSGEVSGVQWCPSDFGKIASCSDDGTVRAWTIARGETSKSRRAVPTTAAASEEGQARYFNPRANQSHPRHSPGQNLRTRIVEAATPAATTPAPVPTDQVTPPQAATVVTEQLNTYSPAVPNPAAGSTIAPRTLHDFWRK